MVGVAVLVGRGVAVGRGTRVWVEVGVRVAVDVGEAEICVGKTVAVDETTTTTGVVAGGVGVGLAQLVEFNITNNNARFSRMKCNGLRICFMFIVPHVVGSR